MEKKEDFLISGYFLFKDSGNLLFSKIHTDSMFQLGY